MQRAAWGAVGACMVTVASLRKERKTKLPAAEVMAHKPWEGF